MMKSLLFISSLQVLAVTGAFAAQPAPAMQAPPGMTQVPPPSTMQAPPGMTQVPPPSTMQAPVGMAHTLAPSSAMQAPGGVARIMAPANSPYTANSAREFAAACKSDQSSCSAVVGQVLMDRIQFSPTSHICLPGVSYADTISTWLAAHPDAANMPARDGIYLALTTLYRCGPPNNY